MVADILSHSLKIEQIREMVIEKCEYIEMQKKLEMRNFIFLDLYLFLFVRI